MFRCVEFGVIQESHMLNGCHLRRGTIVTIFCVSFNRLLEANETSKNAQKVRKKEASHPALEEHLYYMGSKKQGKLQRIEMV